MSSDPCETVWAALEAAGCEPSGAAYKFRARCPAHDGDSRTTLAGGIGGDGRALLWCFKGCDVKQIVAALALDARDLFPTGHRNGRPHPVIAPDRGRRTVDLVLEAARELGLEQRGTRNPGMWQISPCPACRAEPLFVHEDDEDRPRRRVRLWCLGGCEPEAVLDALMGVER